MIDQKFTPFMMHHEVYHDKQRFYDLALEDCTCEECGTDIGWHGSEFINYWVTDEDSSTPYCVDCWEQSASWEMGDCVDCDRPRWVNHQGECQECEVK